MIPRAALVKWSLLVLIAAGTVALDLGTKIWAEDALANREHPLVVELGPEDVGRPVAEVLRERFSDRVDPALAVPAPPRSRRIPTRGFWIPVSWTSTSPSCTGSMIPVPRGWCGMRSWSGCAMRRSPMTAAPCGTMRS